ncbi:MAG: ketoacyl-ACP synthase III [Chitinivibrionales bacterium]|nr:ketoacyl-ACP synthase III [Chitinivibrionales bacterium]
MIAKRAQILSVGTAVPPSIITNADLEKKLDTSDEWITTRTGIKQRHIFPAGSAASVAELGGTAARQALKRADVPASEVDGIICATFTPDCFFPSAACKIQADLGCTSAFAFDISAACAGFVYGLSVGNALIVSGQAKNILLIGAEITSRTLDWNDRGTCILFGDGAGAVLLTPSDNDRTGVLSTFLHSDGRHGDILSLKACGDDRSIRMNGREVYKHAVRMMSEAALTALKQAGVSIDELDYIVPHQANLRIIEAIAQHLKVPPEKMVANVQRYGNTSSASIPLALSEIWQEGKIKPGTTVAFTALGGGLAAGSAIVRF